MRKSKQIYPFFWENNRFYILDQRLLPNKIKYVECKSYKDIVFCIKNMIIRGAPAIGLAGGYALVLAFSEINIKNINFDYVEKVSEEIIASRPTAYNLKYCVDILKKEVFDNLDRKKKIFQILLKRANKLRRENKEFMQKISIFGAELLRENSVVLTHCNAGVLACGDIGTALGIIIEGFRRGKIKYVYVDETRPYLQGARLTILELMISKVPCCLITDNMAAFVIKEKKVDCVIVGADRIARNGDTANKIGTYNLAVVCKQHKVPFYVAAPSSTIDYNIPTGKHIPIEYRDPEELKYINKNLITHKNAQAIHPAFDVTDAKFIDAIITEKGVFKYPYKFEI
ncbi:MAG: S-methyl-5-thioribose-1-phosphate isomerase [Endomicrobia bacterium]|nr:S-methyl-5-thioribose-1-phosphate isomerase [Endomicrobiia bacterium]